MLKKDLIAKVAQLQEENKELCNQILVVSKRFNDVSESQGMLTNRILSDLERRLVILERSQGLNTDDLRQTISDSLKVFLK